MRPNLAKTLLGGFAGTVAMTIMMYFVAPMMLGGPMDVAAALGDMLGGSWTLGMLMHLINGSVVFPVLFTYLLYRILPGDPWLKGVTWGLALWFALQAVIIPMMGGGIFSSKSGGLMVVMASLIAHVLYGALLGMLAGSTGVPSATPQVRAVRMVR